MDNKLYQLFIFRSIFITFFFIDNSKFFQRNFKSLIIIASIADTNLIIFLQKKEKKWDV